MSALTPIDLPPAEQLRLLRQLDQFRRWESLADQRHCLQCGQLISGREVEIVGGTRGLGSLRLQCPSKNCGGVAMDWVLPKNLMTPLFEESAEGVPNERPVPSSPRPGDPERNPVAQRKALGRFMQRLRTGRAR